MTFFSYSCASFGWPVMDPAIRTIFFGFSAANPASGQQQSNSAIQTRQQESLEQLIGDGRIVNDLRRETRRSINGQSNWLRRRRVQSTADSSTVSVRRFASSRVRRPIGSVSLRATCPY